MKNIDVAVAGRFHAHYLAVELNKRSRLRGLYLAHRQILAPKGLSGRQFRNRLDLAAWQALSRFGQIGYTPERFCEIFDSWLLGALQKLTPGVLHAWNGSSLGTFRKLKGSGWLLCVERSCPHNVYQYELLKQEGQALGVPHRQNLKALEMAIEELHLADVIVAPSTYSASSYRDPVLHKKVRVNPLGANVPFRPRGSKPQGRRVLMVGNSFLRKGTHYLIEAFRRIKDPRAELLIRGDVPAEYRDRIRDSRVTVLPPMLPDRLAALYRSADVFVQPSIDEGFGMTVLEALGYGLPLVVTENVGARDLLSPQVSVAVPIRDPDAIAEAIEAALTLPGPAFDAERERILAVNSWGACAERMLGSVYVQAGEP